MGQRYSRILEAAKLAPQLEAFLDYQKNSARRGSRVGKGKPRPKSQALYIDSFGIPLADTQVIRVTASVPTVSAYQSKSQLASRVKTAPGAGKTLIKPDGFKAARIVIASGRSATGVEKTSNVTKAKYLSYGGESTSIPFGRKDGPDTLVLAFDAIKTQLLAGNPDLKISLTQEKV
jgi:hypothetical protein